MFQTIINSIHLIYISKYAPQLFEKLNYRNQTKLTEFNRMTKSLIFLILRRRNMIPLSIQLTYTNFVFVDFLLTYFIESTLIKK